METLEVGMYCYNKTNRKLGIGKIISFPINNNVNIKYKNDIETISIGNVEASHSIIELIQVGDYVNRNEVINITEYKDGSRYIEFDEGKYICKNYQIETIVTKEQMEAIQYKVVE